MTTPTPRTVRLRSGIETINGITGETSPTYSEYVLLEDYQRDLAAAKAELAQERERAEKNARVIERIKRALLPDQHDERELSVDWLRKEIHAAIAGEKP